MEEEFDEKKIEAFLARRQLNLLIHIRITIQDMANTSDGVIPFADFEARFKEKTTTDFKKRYDIVEKHMKHWPVEKVFHDASYEPIVFVLENYGDENAFIRVQRPSEKPGKEPEKADQNSWEELHREKMMFTLPCWKFATEEYRTTNQAIFKQFLYNTNEQTPDMTSRRAKQLAKLWWGSHVKFLWQLLYFLHLFQKKHHFFSLMWFEDRLVEVLPREWSANARNPKVDFELFGTSKSQLVALNIIVRYDVDRPCLFCINPLITKLTFFTITDPKLSFIYQMTSPKNYKTNDERTKNIKQIDMNLCYDLNDYAMPEQEKARLKHWEFEEVVDNGAYERQRSIDSFLKGHQKMFSVRHDINEEHPCIATKIVTANQFVETVVVAMYFSPYHL